MLRNRTLHLCLLVIAGFLLAASSATAQTIAYRQSNLASDVNSPGFSNHVNASLRNSWGLAFFPGQPFFIANANSGRVIAHDAAGSSIGFGSFGVTRPDGTAPDSPTGIAADSNSSFGGDNFVRPFLVATLNGGIFAWGPDPNGDLLSGAILMVDNSQGDAVYTAVAVLTPDCCAPLLAVANFHSGLVETYSTNFAPVGSFTDPNLPPGYAPYGMQIIGGQLFVAFAVQDAAKHDPVFGAGNGIISVFDLQGRFVRRFATAGPLNAPGGITLANANFGPFSNDVLIGNTGDGSISAFDPASGNFLGQLTNANAAPIVNPGIHSLSFRADAFGDPGTLYFTAGINNGQDGLFAAITTGLVSAISVSGPAVPANEVATITATVAAAPPNPGTPTGTVVFQDGSNVLGSAPLVDGTATIDAAFSEARIHDIKASYSGDAAFLPSTSNAQLAVTVAATAVILTAPTDASSASAVFLRASATTQGAIPTGNVEFLDTLSGNTRVIGQAALDASGAAALTVNLVGAGTHTLVAHYQGNANLAASDSAPATIIVADGDFSISANPPAATVTAGQPASFQVTVVPAGGFAAPVTFSCPPLAGVACIFDPPNVTPNAGNATTLLTVSTSAVASGFGNKSGRPAAGLLMASLGLLAALAATRKKRFRPHAGFLRRATIAIIWIPAALSLVSCGGGSSAAPQASRGATSIVVTAQSGSVSHTTTVTLTVR